MPQGDLSAWAPKKLWVPAPRGAWHAGRLSSTLTPMDSDRANWIAVRVAAISAALACAWLLWPTPHRYFRVRGAVIREHRLTGMMERLDPFHGWALMTEDPTDTAYRALVSGEPPRVYTNEEVLREIGESAK